MFRCVSGLDQRVHRSQVLPGICQPPPDPPVCLCCWRVHRKVDPATVRAVTAFGAGSRLRSDLLLDPSRRRQVLHRVQCFARSSRWSSKHLLLRLANVQCLLNEMSFIHIEGLPPKGSPCLVIGCYPTAALKHDAGWSHRDHPGWSPTSILLLKTFHF